MEPRRPVPDGVLAGFVAGIAVIVLFLLYDVVRLAPLSTPVELAGVLFGVEGPGPNISEGPARLSMVVTAVFRVVAYTGVHLAVFAALGAFAVVLFHRLGLRLTPVSGAIYGLVVCTAVLYAAFALVWADFSGPGLAGVLLANAGAGAVMGRMLQEAPDRTG